MGDSRSWAAEQEQDRWEASPEYTVRKALVLRHNAAMKKVKGIPIRGLTFGELQFLLDQRQRFYVRDMEPIHEKSVIRLEGLL